MSQPDKRFTYRSLEELRDAFARHGAELPTSDDVSILTRPASFGRLELPNRFVAQPMEGCDARPDGAPSELTVRKYRRFAAGGSGMLWWEACAVVDEGKANPRQLRLTEGTAEAFAEMLRQTRRAAADEGLPAPACVLQMTHSGRYSRPGAAAEPIIAHHSPILDPKHDLPPDYPPIADERLDALQDAFVRMAELAAEVGFDAVDIKSCHRYLLSELLASFTREGRYGGSFENRTRMLRETAEKVLAAVGDRLAVTTRMNAYDALPHPYGWGVSEADAGAADLSEPIRLVQALREIGCAGVNVTIGNPYYNPHVNRPADWMIAGWPDPPEHPIDGVIRIIDVVRQVQQAVGEFPVVGSGYTWLRQYMLAFAAAFVERGWTSFIGLGRGALAYPDYAKDVIRTGGMDRHKVCVVCSSCTQMMRDGTTAGCVVRDSEVYLPIFREARRQAADYMQAQARQCRNCPDAMCVTGCPAGVDIPGFLHELSEGNERRAYEILREGNPLPGVCGAVCPVEVQCQSRCIRNQLAGAPVEIGGIQRNLARKAVACGWAPLPVPAETSGQHVAVIGAGPAGLAAAMELLARGHRVTVLDRSSRPGGKLGSVIPLRRLGDDETQREIHAILDSVPADRLAWRWHEPLGPGRTLDDVLGEGYDAVVLAVGLGNNLALGEGDRPEGVMDADAFLRHMNAHADHPSPARVAVLGGGNTAMDAAACAARHGARDVFLIYRRGYAEMPAWPEERDGALHDGVHFMVLSQPAGYESDAAGRLTGVRLVRTELGPPGPDGRRRPEPVADSEYVLPVDLAVEAIGESLAAELAEVLSGVRLDADGRIDADADTLATSRPGVWAAGDAVNGGATVVEAVAEGRRAARSIDAALAAASSAGRVDARP